MPLGLGHQPNQPCPLDDGHSSVQWPPFTIPWKPPETLSPLFYDSLESSANPPSYHTSPLWPAVKWNKPDTGHQSFISDYHQHKHYMLTDSPPSSQEKETLKPSGILPRIWLPSRQQPDKTLPEFRSRPHQHHPTRDERSTFRPVAEQCWSSGISVPRILPDNTHGDRPTIEMERDMTRGLDTIQEEPTNTIDITSTNEEDSDHGQMYSSKWMR